MWVCVGGGYGKIEGLKWMKFSMSYLCGFKSWPRWYVVW